MTNKTSTRIILVRHGITDWIEQGILHGVTDRPLSKLGLEQAGEVGRALKNTTAKHLFSSSLSRAVQTAQAIEKETGMALELVDDLQEMDYGWIEGKRDLWPKYKDRKLIIKMYRSARLLSGFLSGEPKSRFKKRVLKGWSAIRSLFPDEDKIVVAHFGVIRVILAHEFNENSDDVTKFVLYPCSITEIEISADAPTRMIRLNDVKHISSGTGW